MNYDAASAGEEFGAVRNTKRPLGLEGEMMMEYPLSFSL
jgi:hypothetical protein